MNERRLINEFSWSFSRQAVFQECRKKYWYTYYGSWEGWPKHYRDARPSIDPLAAYLYALKQMQTLPMFLGSVVHRTIEQFLKERRDKGVEADGSSLVDSALALFETGIQEAQNEAWRLHPKKYAHLFEYHYPTSDAPISDAALAAARERVGRSLTNWYHSPIMQSLAFSPKARWESVEELASFHLQEAYKVFVVVDFSLLWQPDSGDPVLVLFDWKTGSSHEKVEDQLYTYALFAEKVRKMPYARQLLVPFYLFENRYEKIGYRQPRHIDPDRVRSIEEGIIAGSREMTALIPPTPPHTSPMPDVRLFAYTEDRSRCAHCPFKELCQKVSYQECSQEALRACVGP